MSKILVTGAAGFIGFHFSRRLVECGSEVVGLDNLNDYYPVVNGVHSILVDRFRRYVGIARQSPG